MPSSGIRPRSSGRLASRRLMVGVAKARSAYWLSIVLGLIVALSIVAKPICVCTAACLNSLHCLITIMPLLLLSVLRPLSPPVDFEHCEFELVLRISLPLLVGWFIVFGGLHHITMGEWSGIRHLQLGMVPV